MFSGRIYKAIRICVLVIALLGLGYAVTPLPDLWEVAPLWLVAGFVVGTLILGIILYFFFAPGPGSSGTSAFDIETNGAAVAGIIALIILAATKIAELPNAEAIAFASILLALLAYYMYRLIRTNVTMEKENEDVRRRYGELLKIDREKTDFINVTSHQLRTPLTEIHWGIGTLATNPSLDPAARDILQKSLKGTKRLIGIVDDMFRARAVDDNGGSSLKKELINVGTLIASILTGLQGLASEKQTAISFSQPERDITVSGDKEKLARAIQNVIETAIRYSPKKTTSIAASTESGYAVIRVADTGIGIPPEDSSRVFTRFYRGKNALLVQPDGSGIGLYNTQYIVQQHGGDISYVSTLGQGTIFKIRIPLAS